MTPARSAVIVLVLLCGPYVLIVAGPTAFLTLLLVTGAITILRTRHRRRTHPKPTGATPTAGRPHTGRPHTGRPHTGGPHTNDGDTGQPLGAARVGDDAEVAALSDEQLCWGWRRSYCQLLAATEPWMVSAIVARRQEILDELAHRDPRGFTAWMDSGARAGGDPTRYLRVTRLS